MIFPTLSEIRRIADGCNVVPVWTSILADTETPVSVWMKLYRREAYSFLLESVCGEETVSRYSFLGGRPFLIFRANGRRWELSGTIDEKGEGDPFARLRALLACYRPPALQPAMPRFCGGAVGFFGYDAIRLWERIPNKNPHDELLDEIWLGFYRDLIIFDNKEHRILLIANILTNEYGDVRCGYRDACARIEEMEHRLAASLLSARIVVGTPGKPRSNFRHDEFVSAVNRCKEYIRAGDIFQVVLSQRFSVAVEAHPFDLYRILRTVNPSPYMFFLSCGEAAVVGASPEMLVRVENRRVQTRPIAGTRPRGRDEQEDQRLADELKRDPKECAEHVMLVDLGRNDLGRVCEYGSVVTTDIMHIEKYSHVMHLVTNVEGRLRSDADALAALQACFPAGTLCGAPKIRAMEIIDEQEPLRRGIYGGALGYIDFGGNLDSCIVIRTIIYKKGVAYVQAGAGIVADSVAEREYEETVNKAMAPVEAIMCANNIAQAEPASARRGRQPQMPAALQGFNRAGTSKK